jgi:quinol monooxygenase YgiN
MSELQVTARFTIHDGKLAEFKALAAECMKSVREKDTGTLQYDWFFDSDETVCVVRETYRDSAAVFEHIGNLGDTFGALLATADIDLEVFGTPTQELIDGTAELGPRIYGPFQSL